MEDGKLSTDVYHKPIGAYQYLNFRSCHPPHVKKGIPYSQTSRLKRICDLEDKFGKGLVDLKGFLVNRGYKEDFVNSQCSRVTEVRRAELLCKNQKRDWDKKERVVLVLNYHFAMLKVHRIFRELHVPTTLSPMFSWFPQHI